MKLCDLTQFYSPVSGGVKRYVHEKVAYIKKYCPEDEHVLVVPGPKTELTANGRSRIYSIRSQLVSRTSRYRALLNLRSKKFWSASGPTSSNPATRIRSDGRRWPPAAR